MQSIFHRCNTAHSVSAPTMSMLQYVRRQAILSNRKHYMSPSVKTFETYDTPIVLERGNGVYLWDDSNKKYIDTLGQNLCVSIGYNHPRIIERATQQLHTLPHCTTVYYHEQSTTLAKAIVERMPAHPSGDEWVVHFVNSGSEAVDLAVQMARTYTGKQEMYALHKGYHGLQGCAAGLTAIGKATQSTYHTSYPAFKHIVPNDIDSLQHDLKYATSGAVAGIVMEPVQGYGGVFPLDDGFMREAFECVRRCGGVAIADEVQTGYGRCGDAFWGFELANNQVVPDMVTIAKGMGNGVGLLGAVVARRSIAEAFTDKVFFNTYGANPFSCAVGNEVLSVIDEENITQNCKQQGYYLQTQLRRLCEKYPSVYSDARGVGLFQGLEVYGKHAEDSQKRAKQLHKELLSYGVIMGRGSAQGNLFRLQPPMSIQREELCFVVDALEYLAEEHK